MKNVLIFGAAGFVGPHLIHEFASNGYAVFGADVIDKFDSAECEYFQNDITDTDEVELLIKRIKPDYIVNLAAISSVSRSWKNPSLTFKINVLGTVNILQSLVNLSLKETKVLVVGSSEEYIQKSEPLSVRDELNPNNPYGISKMTQESISKLYEERYGLKIIKTRSFNHTGVGQKDAFVIPSFCKQTTAIAMSGKHGTIYVGNLTAIRDISDVRDIVGCYRYLLENKDTGIYNVGSGEAHSMQELLDYIVKKSGGNIDVVTDPAKIRPVDTPYICCKKGELDYKFRHSIYDAIDWMLDSYKSQKRAN